MKKIIFLFVLCMVSCKNGNTIEKDKAIENGNQSAKVTLAMDQGRYTLMVNGEPFYIKGAGLEFGDVPSLASHNGNSFRTWRTANGQKTAVEVLDEAHENGLMVTMGIEVARERHGFDYNDTEAVAEQLADIKAQVMALKDHPALLIWGIGNELNLHYTNPKVWDAVNEISKMIHTVDGNHPTTTSLAGISQKEINFIKERCSDLDILSVQMYGDLPNLPKLIEEFKWEGPYIVTEWGATGHWEVPKTAWEAPIEQNSSVKADNYLRRFKAGIAVDEKQCLGSYVFLWGNKQERTPTWYGIFLEDGKETESVDVMHYLWNGEWPENRTPRIEKFTLDGKTAYQNVSLQSGKQYEANVAIMDYENDAITYRWEILPESTDLGEGGDYESRPKTQEGLFAKQEAGKLLFNTPPTGAYRLFVYGYDGGEHAATANIPFFVK